MNLEELLDWFRPPIVNSRTGSRRRRRFWAEPLEDRTLLANFHVLTGGDGTLGSCTGAGCTLRDAVNAANASPGPDEITFAGNFFDSDPTDESYSITLDSELVVTESLTINGFGEAALSISGNDATRLFRFGGSGANTYTLNNLTLAHGSVHAGGGGAVVMELDADDTLNIHHTVIRDSSASEGGGVYSVAGTLNIRNSAVVNNEASSIGGGLALRNGTTTLTNVTISGNQAASQGAGIDNTSVGEATGLTILNSTIVNNSGPSGTNLRNFDQSGGATVVIQNSVFAMPQGSSNIENFGAAATITSLGNNISDDATGNLNATGDKQNTPAQLGPLRYNNSNLPTHAPLFGSPAIDAGADLSGSGVTTDQRGFNRPQGAAFDIGAHEARFDFGDAPTAAQSGLTTSYPTVIADSGAVHSALGPRLGTNRDAETNGQPDVNARGDDAVEFDDEDGIIFASAGFLTRGASNSIQVDLQNADASSNRLDAWVDFDHNGVWESSEKVFASFDLGTTDGVQTKPSDRCQEAVRLMLREPSPSASITRTPYSPVS